MRETWWVAEGAQPALDAAGTVLDHGSLVGEESCPVGPHLRAVLEEEGEQKCDRHRQ